MKYAIEIVKRGKQYHLRLVGSNGECVMSGEPLKNHKDALKTAMNVMNGEIKEVIDKSGAKRTSGQAN